MHEDSIDYASLGLNASELKLYKKLGRVSLDNIISARTQKSEIIRKWKDFFRKEIAENHYKNTLKLAQLKGFKQSL